MRVNENKNERKDKGAPFLKCTFSPESEWLRKPHPDQAFATVRRLRFGQNEACGWWIGAHGYLTMDFAGMKTTDLRDERMRKRDSPFFSFCVVVLRGIASQQIPPSCSPLTMKGNKP